MPFGNSFSYMSSLSSLNSSGSDVAPVELEETKEGHVIDLTHNTTEGVLASDL